MSTAPSPTWVAAVRTRVRATQPTRFGHGAIEVDTFPAGGVDFSHSPRRTFPGPWRCETPLVASRGETAGATFGVGIVTILFMLPVAILAADIVVLGGLGGALLVAASLLFVAYLFTTTLGSIARLALYVYATDGQRPSAFEDVDLGRGPE
ncbi:hypothetical protein [Halorubellus sp. PRR65]|uniref:hypothetical protein n=1 Tax=Halorubellus sp. PRR65 TaxID=3098148 RepID=UPI002B2636EB|nr:hypothetical protein [Halorubellus sp. PRR65]